MRSFKIDEFACVPPVRRLRGKQVRFRSPTQAHLREREKQRERERETETERERQRERERERER